MLITNVRHKQSSLRTGMTNGIITGMTLVELMIVIVVAAILIAATIPSFREIMQNNRASSATSEFVRAIQFTRSEAIKRGETISICASANASQTACGTAAQWSNGWLIFTDQNSNGVYNSADDQILATQQALTGGLTLTAAAASVSFAGTGFLQAGNGTYQVGATGCSGNHMNDISLSNNGRLNRTYSACS